MTNAYGDLFEDVGRAAGELPERLKSLYGEKSNVQVDTMANAMSAVRIRLVMPG